MNIKSKPMMIAVTCATVVWLIGAVLAATEGQSSVAAVSQETQLAQGIAYARMLVAQQTAQPASQGGTARNPIMVEDVFKNVQELKGITIDDFMGTMGLMSASLGFCCNDCHTGAGTDKVVWEADNAKKRTARRMVAMVRSVNKENFNGRQVVTCWTCHRGRDFPVVTPRLDYVYSEPTIELDDVLTRAEGVPSVDDILNKYLQTIGGADKVNAIKSIVAKGKSVGFGGFGGGGQVEFYAQAPDKRAVYIHFPDAPDRGDSTRTYDGRVGWIATPLTVVRKYQLTGGELDGARIDAQLSFPGQIKASLMNLRVGPPTEILGKDVNTMQGNGPRGSLANLYFDRQTNLLVRISRYGPSPIGRVPTQVDYADYRDVGGIKFPYRWTFTWLDGRDSFEFADVQFNQQIDASKFAEPNPFAATQK